MRWVNGVLCCLLLAFTLAGASAPLLATDLKSPRQPYPDERSSPRLTEKTVAKFCYEQHIICRKICRLRDRFEDRFNGCPSSCESRQMRCNADACFRWLEPEFVIAERFGGFKCL